MAVRGRREGQREGHGLARTERSAGARERRAVGGGERGGKGNRGLGAAVAEGRLQGRVAVERAGEGDARRRA